MRVLGVDPGLTRCGLGVVDGAPGRRLTLVEVSVARSDAGRPARATAAHHRVRRRRRCSTRTTPDAVAVERVFSQHNVRTVMGVAQVSGVVLAAAARRGLPVALHTPSEVKAAVTGHGRADKAQVGAMVARLLGLDRGTEAGRRRRCPGAGDLPRVARIGADAADSPLSPRHSRDRRAAGDAMIASSAAPCSTSQPT